MEVNHWRCHHYDRDERELTIFSEGTRNDRYPAAGANSRKLYTPS